MMVMNTSGGSHSVSELSSSASSPTSSPATPIRTSADRQIRNSHSSLSKPQNISRRRSKGLIAGYADSPIFQSPKHHLITNTNVASSKSPTTIGQSSTVPLSKAQQLQNVKNSAIQAASKSSHSARLALLCVNATLSNFGTVLKLSLCPRKMRKRIMQENDISKSKRLSSARQQIQLQQQFNEEQEQHEMKLLEQFQQDDESSGDEEDEQDEGEHIDDPPPESGKLAFGRRKISFFDKVTAQERETARIWLKRETEAGTKKDRQILDTYLKNVQQMQSQGLIKEGIESGSPTTEKDFDFFMNVIRSSDISRGDRYPDTKFPSDKSLSLHAAYILESLSYTPLESLEGMHKCYDGLVSAGTALLEEEEKYRSSTNTSSSSSSKHTNSDSKNKANNVTLNQKNSRNKILAALATILITNLDHTSGETILSLARLRSLCGTSRYKRRFTQRIAPLLIRPPNSAIWCLKHQTDMRAIVAVTEILFDAASDVFSNGWYERGRLLLADGRRAENLNAAARQLRALSKGNESTLSHRKSHSSTLVLSNVKGMEGTNSDLAGQHHLAEWEILAVDARIRESISSLFTKDWTKINITLARAQSSGGTTSEVSLRRDSRSPRHQMQVPLSPHSGNENMVPSGGTRLHHSNLQINSPSKSPTSSSKTLQSTHRSQQLQGPRQSNQINQQSQKTNNSPETASTPMTPTPITIPPPITPPRSPTSPNKKKPSSPSMKRDHLLSTAPQMPTISTFNQSSNTESRLQPAPPLSPTPSTSSIHSQRSHLSSHSSSTFGSTNRPSATERKRTVAACRALRAQINRFEDAFFAQNGRPPKGALERAPLATTYAQYREWKRNIRADAACRIQAIFRGARLRIEVEKNGSVNDFYSRWRSIILRVRRRNTGSSYPSQLSIPVEIDEVGESGQNGFIGFNGDEGRGDGVEVVISPHAEPKTYPNQQTHSKGVGMWQRRRNPSNEKSSGKPLKRLDGGKGRSSQSHQNQHQQNQSSSISSETNISQEFRSNIKGSEVTNASSSLEHMTLSELLTEKRNLKNRLKQYDMDFHRKHKRMPVKVEKEPIRHLYEIYNSLKSRIQTLSNNDNNSISTSATPQLQTMQSERSVVASRYSQDSFPEAHSPATSRHVGRRDKQNSTSSSSTLSSLSSGTPSGATSSDRLEILRAEKTKLHQMLRSYEKDFYKEYQRQVSSFADIRPVASQYRRYKEIKKCIAALQDGKPSGGSNGR